MEEKKYLITICDGDVGDLYSDTSNYICFRVTESEKDFLVNLAMEHDYQIALQLLKDEE